MKPIRLFTTQSLDTCYARLELQAAIENSAHTVNGHSGKTPIIARRKGMIFRLHKCPHYLNSPFIPYFYGKFIPSDNGTIIEGKFRVRPMVALTALAFFLFFVSLALLEVVSAIFDHQSAEAATSGGLYLWVSLSLVLLAIAMYGRYLIGLHDETDIKNFLSYTFEGVEIKGAT